MELGEISRELGMSDADEVVFRRFVESLVALQTSEEHAPVVALHARDVCDKSIASAVRLTPAAVNKIVTRERRRLGVDGKATLAYLLCARRKSD